MLRTKLFQQIALLMLVFGALSGFIGTRFIKNHTLQEAQRRVQLDMSSAWAVYQAQLDEVRTIVELTAGKKMMSEFFDEEETGRADLLDRLEVVRRSFGLDFLTVVSGQGVVLLRAAPPYRTGDHLLADPFVAAALRGEGLAGSGLLEAGRLAQEGSAMTERAFLALEDTKRARPSPLESESRGMIMAAAAPVSSGGRVVGAVYGGILLNRNDGIVDRIKTTVYKDQTYDHKPVGSATIFLKDHRVATTVRLPNGNRALGTRVSKDVADTVLDNALSWLGRAFVVNDWHLTAYDPIRDIEGNVIGMLYVGTLEKPYRDMERQVLYRYAGLLVFGLLAAVAIAFLFAGKLAQPLHRLAEAARLMRQGKETGPVACEGACSETESLILSFNQMTVALKEREARLLETNEAVERANTQLTALNRSYMDMLGFVSHELKSPVASIINYAFLLRTRKIGPLTERQEKAVRSIESSSKRLVEMVRHYLNLSRIENGELRPTPTRVPVLKEVVRPLLDAAESDLEERGLRVENRLDERIVLDADLNMTREAFENLISNAVKYGREGGCIRLSAEEEGGFWRFRVWNEGEGVPADRMDALFEKFSRIEGAASRGRKGTGLGLFITRHVVEAHGGRIEAASSPGQWIEFTFTLPRHDRQPNEEKSTPCPRNP